MFSELITISLVGLWGVQHSILASNWMKHKFGVDAVNQYYRIGFNIIGGFTFIALEVVIGLALVSQGTTFPPLVDIATLLGQGVYYLFLGVGGIIAAGAFLQTRPLVFAGLQREKLSDLHLHGFYRVARHPMYTGVILILFALIITTNNSVIVAKYAGYIAYFVFGAMIEERRLLKTFGGYQSMFTRGFLFPYKRSHFAILFGNSKKQLSEGEIS